MKPSIHYSLGWGFFRFSFLFSVVFYVGARGRMLSRPEGEKQQLKTRVSTFQHFIPVTRRRRGGGGGGGGGGRGDGKVKEKL